MSRSASHDRAPAGGAAQTSRSPSLAHAVERRLPTLYMLAALLLGGLYALITPPFFSPDEVAQSMRGLQIAHGTLLANSNPAGQGEFQDSAFSSTVGYFAGLINTIIHQPNHARAVPRITRESLEHTRAVCWSGGSSFDSFAMTRIYPPTLFLPAALMWRLSEARRFTILHSLLLTRLSNLVAAVALGWLALRLGRACRWSVAALLLAPVLVSLDGSCSQDALIISAAALGLAVLSRALADRRLPVTRELVLAGIALCVVGMTRPPYTLLIVSLCLPAMELRQLNRHSLSPIIVVALPALALDLCWYVAVRPLGFLVGPGANPPAQFAFFRHHLLQALLNVLLGLLRDLPVLTSSLTEAGSGDVRPPRFVAVLVLLLLIATFISQTPLLRRRSSRVLALLVCLGISVQMAAAEYIIWTAPGATHLVDGLQVRHFLVFLPLLALLGGSQRRPRAHYLQFALLALVTVDVCLLLYDTHTFYGTGLISALSIAQR